MIVALGMLGAPLGEARAVLIDTGDGTGNTTAPIGDPGFANVGVVNGLSGVYVRNGWVLTASHVGEHPILLAGATWDPIPGSRVRLRNPDGSDVDLIAFKLQERPPLPDLQLAATAPAVKDDVILIGHGRNRGGATSWSGLDGWGWAAGKALRWGTNEIDELLFVTQYDTQAIATSFDALRGNTSGLHEADVVTGDSGGAVFRGSGAGAELIGILFARATFVDQTPYTSIYGNKGYAVDLHHYRAELLAIIDQPDCDDGLDEDGDGLADYPDDPGCSSPTDTDEREPSLACDNGLDDDGDGTIDLGDRGCTDPGDTSERGAPEACDNGLDDDLDALIDYPDDPDCASPSDTSELPEPGFATLMGLGGAALSALARRRSPRRSRGRVERPTAGRVSDAYSSTRSTR